MENLLFITFVFISCCSHLFMFINHGWCSVIIDDRKIIITNSNFIIDIDNMQINKFITYDCYNRSVLLFGSLFAKYALEFEYNDKVTNQNKKFYVTHDDMDLFITELNSIKNDANIIGYQNLWRISNTNCNINQGIV